MSSQRADDGINQTKFCWKCRVQLLEICVQTHNLIITQKNSQACTSSVSFLLTAVLMGFWTPNYGLQFCDGGIRAHQHTEIFVFNMIVMYSSFCFWYDCFHLGLWNVSPLHYCCNNNIVSINHKNIFLPTQ